MVGDEAQPLTCFHTVSDGLYISHDMDTHSGKPETEIGYDGYVPADQAVGGLLQT